MDTLWTCSIVVLLPVIDNSWWHSYKQIKRSMVLWLIMIFTLTTLMRLCCDALEQRDKGTSTPAYKYMAISGSREQEVTWYQSQNSLRYRNLAILQAAHVSSDRIIFTSWIDHAIESWAYHPQNRDFLFLLIPLSQTEPCLHLSIIMKYPLISKTLNNRLERRSIMQNQIASPYMNFWQGNSEHRG
jgi:hypothetical protein